MTDLEAFRTLLGPSDEHERKIRENERSRTLLACSNSLKESAINAELDGPAFDMCFVLANMWLLQSLERKEPASNTPPALD